MMDHIGQFALMFRCAGTNLKGRAGRPPPRWLFFRQDPMITQHDQRRTSQVLAPHRVGVACPDAYCLYPTFPTPPGSIALGFRRLAGALAVYPTVRIDGFVGVDWQALISALQAEFDNLHVDAVWIDVSTAYKDEADLQRLIDPYLGGDDPLFGTRCQLPLTDFFAADQLHKLLSETEESGCTIAYGVGAALLAWEGPLVYVDLPKNELQFRSRAGAVKNLAASVPDNAKTQYKRFYFVDWPVLNGHKAEIVDGVDWFVDGQRPHEPTVIAGDTLRDALSRMSRNAFRVRPWFEPGPWGGQWIKNRITALPADVPNYAWSFELITPENGITFCDGEYLLEVSFDWLMYRENQAVLGDSTARFGTDFPIRFDFLDTFDGGNLSIQCHPRPEYIRQHFGETFTQDETYYILDCRPQARVYLGFVEGVDRTEFKAALEQSAGEGVELDVERFVNTEPSRKHDLYLIPSGTIHASGANNLVLEISATPYLFTFKMYDWLRMDLDGQPRPLNIDRALENLYFQRQADHVGREFISRPKVVDAGDDWRLLHLPTHPQHFYDVQRYEFVTCVSGHTGGSPQVMMLVEGESILVQTGEMQQTFHYAETFVIPAAACSFQIKNLGDTPAMVIKAFVKPNMEEQHSRQTRNI